MAVSAPLHLVAVALCVWSASKAIASLSSDGATITVTYGSIPSDPDSSPQDLLLPGGDDSEATPPRRLDVAGFQFDIERIRSRREALFPFLTADLMFLDPSAPQTRGVARSFVNIFGFLGRLPEATPLVMSDAAVQQMIDDAWSRRGRWSTFKPIARMLEAHDANHGRAADLVRAYVDQNILQLFCEGRTKDPALWGVLENAADHTDFIDFVRTFGRQRPSSRTMTELLFLLDELAQASRDALLMLMALDLHPELQETARVRPDAYELAVTLQRDYGAWLTAHGLTSAAAIQARYDDLRLRLLTAIVETTPDGYRGGDARFLAGEICFRRGEVAHAMRWWRGILVEPASAHADLATQLLTAIGAADVRTMDIKRVLGTASGRARVQMIDRMRRFGHTCDTF